MKSVALPAVALLILEAGCVSRTVGFGDDAGPAMGDDASSLTGLRRAGAACGIAGEVHVTCAEGLVCVMNVCEPSSSADDGGAADAVGDDVSTHVDSRPEGGADSGAAPAVRPAAPTLAVGGDHTCVLRAGKIACWGDNARGELGIGVTGGPQSCDNNYAVCSTTPVTVTGLSAPVESVAAGGGETCALYAGGTVACWGANDYGQLGNGSTSGPETCEYGVPCATTPHVVSGVSGATAVVTNGQEACALLSSGAVECWGTNLDGDLGNPEVEGGVGGGTAPIGMSPVPVEVTGLTRAVAVSLGNGYACALLLDGTIQCWGDDIAGQLGNGSMADSTTPIPVSGVTGAVAVAAGWDHACALKADGTVVCWGDNGNGALGLGTSSGPETCTRNGGSGEPCSTTPVKVPDLTGVTAIAAGLWDTCAILSDRTVRCWGWNYHGELGDGTMVDESPTPVVVSGLTGATAISLGDESACALVSGGNVVCWGQNALGQLASPDTGPQICATSGYPCSTTPVSVSGL